MNILNLFKNSNELVEEIHQEVDSAQERLLSEANDLLSKLEIMPESDIEAKAERLKAVGFVSTPLAKKADSLKELRQKNEKTIVETKSQAELIQYYKQNYPFQKFLTEAELDRICNKYGLIYAPVKNYIKEVPEKNLREIESIVKLKDEDNKIPLNKPREKKIKSEAWTQYDQYLEDYSNGALGFRRSRDASFDGFFIAAPKEHFDLRGLTQDKNRWFVAPNPDPIVFRYVRGGIQVISKWGLEAKDELLVNEKLN